MTSASSFFARDSVKPSRDLTRIASLPRRRWEDGAEQLAKDMTEFLRTPTGEMVLRPVQAAALAEAYDHAGMFGMIGVGHGKTLISLLAPTVFQAQRPLLLVPAELRKKTYRDIETLRSHWRLPEYLRIESYELLGREQSSDLLEKYQPDLFICDEGHRLKDPRTAVTRRVARYQESRPTCMLIMSGTPTKRSIKDYWHLVRWCLPKNTPVPEDERVMWDWGMAIDEGLDPFRRFHAGALRVFFNDAEKELAKTDEASAGRKAYGRRLADTPGVIATVEQGVDCSIRVNLIENKIDSKVLDEAFDNLRKLYQTPDGHEFADGVTLWRHARELACGFYYRWNPRPPKPWIDARKAWCAFAREVLSENRQGLDSELQVARAYTDTDEHRIWSEIRPSFKPNTEAVWIDFSALEHAAKWAKVGPGIIWTEHVAWAKKLADLTGLAYYGTQGEDAKTGRLIDDHPKKEALIASVDSNKAGRNLQAWYRNLNVSLKPTGLLRQQQMGRTHRPGQKADEVIFDELIGCVDQFDGFEKVLRDAKYLQDTTGEPQKVLLADVVGLRREEVRSRKGPRWNK